MNTYQKLFGNSRAVAPLLFVFVTVNVAAAAFIHAPVTIKTVSVKVFMSKFVGSELKVRLNENSSDKLPLALASGQVEQQAGFSRISKKN